MLLMKIIKLPLDATRVLAHLNLSLNTTRSRMRRASIAVGDRIWKIMDRKYG